MQPALRAWLQVWTRTPKRAVNFDLFFNVAETKNGLVIDCDYNAAYFERKTIERFLAQYERLMLAAISQPQSAIADLALIVSANSSQQSLQSSTETTSSVASAQAAIEALASSIPDSKAIDSNGRTSSHEGVQRLTRRWATALAALGRESVNPDCLRFGTSSTRLRRRWPQFRGCSWNFPLRQATNYSAYDGRGCRRRSPRLHRPLQPFFCSTIDGTLIRRAGPHHRAALENALFRVTGLRATTDYIPVQGMLDRDILREMLRGAGASRRVMNTPDGADRPRSSDPVPANVP